MSREKAKITLLDIGILFLDILFGICIFIFVVVTFPFWILLLLGDFLCEMYVNCQASLDYQRAMKEIKGREEK